MKVNFIYQYGGHKDHSEIGAGINKNPSFGLSRMRLWAAKKFQLIHIHDMVLFNKPWSPNADKGEGVQYW